MAAVVGERVPCAVGVENRCQIAVGVIFIACLGAKPIGGGNDPVLRVVGIGNRRAVKARLLCKVAGCVVFIRRAVAELVRKGDTAVFGVVLKRFRRAVGVFDARGAVLFVVIVDGDIAVCVGRGGLAVRIGEGGDIAVAVQLLYHAALCVVGVRHHRRAVRVHPAQHAVRIVVGVARGIAVRVGVGGQFARRVVGVAQHVSVRQADGGDMALFRCDRELFAGGCGDARQVLAAVVRERSDKAVRVRDGGEQALFVEAAHRTVRLGDLVGVEVEGDGVGIVRRAEILCDLAGFEAGEREVVARGAGEAAIAVRGETQNAAVAAPVEERAVRIRMLRFMLLQQNLHAHSAPAFCRRRRFVGSRRK